jgi:uncharacterized membrane protein YphA (DoxX/SURF4 family)
LAISSMNSTTARLRQFLNERVDASSLGLFRIVWGLLMVWEAIRKLPKVSGMYSPEYFHFKYALFPFVEPLPEVWMMRVEVCAMLAAGILIAAGIWFRGASAVFLLVYTHLFLIEKLYYNNHFYLTILVGFLLAISDAYVCYRFRWPGKRKLLDNDAPPTLNRNREYVSQPLARINITAQSTLPKQRSKVSSLVKLGAALVPG